MATDIDDWLSFQLAAALDGKPVVVMVDVLAAASGLVGHLHDHGVPRVLVVAGARGTGVIDDAVERDALVVGTSGAGVMGSIRAFLAVMAAPPTAVRDAIERFDPDHEAVVVGPLFTEAQHVLGRPVLGARPWTWQALEDKTVVDGLWDRAGVARAPSRITSVRRSDMEGAAAELDEGHGTVWVADNRSGWHGGAEHARWVAGPEDVDEAAATMAVVAERVRVMPFLEGLPCSIHGWVFDDHVATFSPVELLVLRDEAARRFVYAGAATTWRPATEVTTTLRAVADAVGRQLRDEVGYRGVFTVDGVLTAGGFRPTELNPRWGVGMALQTRGNAFPGYLVHAASISRPDLDWRAAELEDSVRRARESETQVHARVLLPVEPGEAEVRLTVAEGAFVPDDDGATVVATAPFARTGHATVSFAEDLEGRPAAPYVAAALNATSRSLGHGLPTLVPAPLA